MTPFGDFRCWLSVSVRPDETHSDDFDFDGAGDFGGAENNRLRSCEAASCHSPGVANDRAREYDSDN